MAFRVPNQYRLRRGPLATGDAAGLLGVFMIPPRPGKVPLKVIAHVGTPEAPWEHVSVSLPDRCPTWEEMCKVKSLFWEDEDCVMQLHPPRSQWISNHPYCLHLWRPHHQAIPLPPSDLVGVKEWGTLERSK